MAVKADGTFWYWGAPSLRPDYSSWNSNVGLEMQQMRDGIARAVAGDCYYLMLTTDGSLIARNQCNNELFLGEYVSEALVGGDFVQADGGARHAVGLKRDGSVWMWGDNSLGQIGDGRTSVAFPLVTASQILIATDISSVSGGVSHVLALKSDGRLVTWGYGGFGQLGGGNTLQANSMVSLGSGFSHIATSDHTSFAIKSDGTLWSWGYNGNGILGNGTTDLSSSPGQIGTGFTQVSAGGEHAAALQADGSLWTWGENRSGELGNGSTVRANTPQRIGTGFAQATIKSSAFGSATFALDAGGTLWAWGYGFTGAYGEGSTLATPPAQFDTRRFTTVTVAERRVDATRADGSVWVPFDITGTSVATQSRPVLIETGFVSQFDSSIHSSDNFTLALKSDGALWGWGDNRRGQLGAGLPSTLASPALLGSGFKKLTSGNGYALALKTDGSLLGWGDNVVLQLGRTPIVATQVTFQGQSAGNAINGLITATGPANNLTLTATLTPDPTHTQGNMFLVAILPDGRVFTNTLTGWAPLDAVKREGYGSGLRATTVNLLIGVNTADLKGTLIYQGYGLGATATESWDEMLGSRRFKLGAMLE